MARKVGIDNAKGTYIYHVDSDDWLVPKTLDLLLREAIITDADIVVANFYRTLDGFGIIKQKSNVGIFQKRLISQKEFLNDYYKSFFGINVFQVSMCGKLYRREFLQNLDIELLGFDLGEDLNYNIQVFPKAKNILFLSDFVYNYRFGGMTTKFNDKLITAAVEMYAIKKKYTKEYNRDDLNRYIIIELKNFMRTHIEMLVKFKKSVTNEDHKRIIALLDNSEYTDAINFFATQDIGDDLFVKAMIKKDSEKLVQISAEKVRKEFIKDSVKKCISRLFAN